VLPTSAKPVWPNFRQPIALDSLPGVDIAACLRLEACRIGRSLGNFCSNRAMTDSVAPVSFGLAWTRVVKPESPFGRGVMQARYDFSKTLFIRRSLSTHSCAPGARSPLDFF
jgi:hypothetical protein